jgi:hypothetical protein
MSYFVTMIVTKRADGWQVAIAAGSGCLRCHFRQVRDLGMKANESFAAMRVTATAAVRSPAWGS